MVFRKVLPLTSELDSRNDKFFKYLNELADVVFDRDGLVRIVLDRVQSPVR